MIPCELSSTLQSAVVELRPLTFDLLDGIKDSEKFKAEQWTGQQTGIIW